VLARTTLITQHEGPRDALLTPHLSDLRAGGASLMVFVTSSMFEGCELAEKPARSLQTARGFCAASGPHPVSSRTVHWEINLDNRRYLSIIAVAARQEQCRPSNDPETSGN
jgi:hypothetical protein